MSFPESIALSGFLIGFRRELGKEWFSLPEVLVEPSSQKGWRLLILTSRTPLLGEVDPEASSFKYFLVMRESGEHSLLLGGHTALVDVLLDKLGLREYVFCPAVNIHDLVKGLAGKPRAYLMSAVYARVQGFGQSLRSIAFYGADVGDARLFREMLEDTQTYRVQPYRVTLREAEKGDEIVSIGSRGEVNFYYNGADSLTKVDEALRFLTLSEHIDWNKKLALSLR